MTVNVTNVNEAPKFPSATDTLTVEENENNRGAKKVVGAVMATDDGPGSPEYTLSGTDASSFEINKDSGQIKAKVILDYETKKTYSVVVTATDGAGLKGSITLTIEVTNVIEPALPNELTITDDGEDKVKYSESSSDAVDTYKVEGPKADTALWVVEGTDADDFMVDGSPGASVMLKFNGARDYETPTDRAGTGDSKAVAGDNVYHVTLKVMTADDPTIMDTLDVEVTVEDADEKGSVMIQSGTLPDTTTALVGTEITVTLNEEDSGVANTAWQWSKSMTETGEYMDITDAKSPSYTPVKDDAGMYLKATVTYDDVHGTDKEESSALVDVMALVVNGDATPSYAENGTDAVGTYTANVSGSTLSLAGDDAEDFNLSADGELTFKVSPDFETPTDMDTDNVYDVAVVATYGTSTGRLTIAVTVTNENEAPAFAMDTDTREIAENSEAETAVGDPVVATDQDADDTLAYTLGGDDADSFDIDAMGQITVGKGTTLDYEAEKNTYMVTVTATDSTDMTDSIGVTINVTNENEAPAFADDTVTTLSVEENTAAGTAIGDPIAATDQDAGDTLTYSLSGDGMASFDIDAMGQITVGEGATLDYETKTSYEVTVTATDSKDMTDSIDVTINVTDVEEGPVVRYDEDNDGAINATELSDAIGDYNAGTLDSAELSEVIAAYING